MPAELVESELFGHERGAFTGAVTRKLGRLEMAQTGTIVLDEVAALAPGMQAKLLRVLEERTFERLGGTETLRMEARLMALTNTDLAKAAADGRFREDLFFRLNVLAIVIPPLRERRSDIPELAAHFLARLGPVHGRADAAFEPSAASLLESYEWPGNVRELKNAVEHALVFAKQPQTARRRLPGNYARGNQDSGGSEPVALTRRFRTRNNQGDARGHALQNRPLRRNPRHQPQNPAREAQKIRVAVTAGAGLRRVVCVLDDVAGPAPTTSATGTMRK